MEKLSYTEQILINFGLSNESTWEFAIGQNKEKSSESLDVGML